MRAIYVVVKIQIRDKNPEQKIVLYMKPVILITISFQGYIFQLFSSFQSKTKS